MKHLLTALFAIVLVYSFSLTVHALDLNEARSKKLVTEEPDGYVKAVDPSAKALAEEVNTKRKAAYEEAAKAAKVDIKVIAEKAAKEIKEKLGK
ncbi:MAG: DUF1318 domain-containing protein [Bdellovibrionaceae bacterium]|nr:DUF1318 domain-containing protein [Pseudobdellovibrionaceae bacterium]